MLNTIFSILIFLYCCLSFGGTIDPKNTDSQHIEYAQKFDYVGKLCGDYVDKTKFCASAIAIDDHHILTAAHVVKDSTSSTFEVNGKVFCIEKMIYNKDFESKFGVGDIAIGYSTQSFDLDFYPELYTTQDESNKNCNISGFGLTGTFVTGAVKSDGRKRAGSNYIDRVEDDLIICSPSYRNCNTHTPLEFFIASGDSGGGLFIDNKLAGINSFIMVSKRSPRSTYGEESGHTRISRYIKWIKDNKHEKK